MKARAKSGSSTMPTPARGNRNGNAIDQRKPWPSEMLKFQSRRKIHFKVGNEWSRISANCLHYEIIR